MKYFFLVLTICTLSVRSQTINTAPLDAYWNMIEPLKKGDSLSIPTWQSFLDIEANKVYINNQGFSEAYLESFRKNIQYVYMPKYDSLLKARLIKIEQDPASYWLTYKVYVYKKYEDSLKAYQAKLHSPSYMDAMYTNAWTWLPKKLQQKDSALTIYFLGFENDAIAGGGQIIETLWSAYNQDKIKTGILGAHEIHHVLRQPKEFQNVANHDQGIVYFLNGVLNEGTADMVDKALVLANEQLLPMEFQFGDFLLYQADSIIRQVDTSLQLLASSRGAVFKTEKDYRNLIRWTSGHCPGFYMTDIIVKNGFKKQLLAHIQNPFYFIYLYNKAARQDTRHPARFSRTSIAYVKKMERKYWSEK